MRPTRRRVLGLGAAALAGALLPRGARAGGYTLTIGACRAPQDAALFARGGAEFLEISCAGELVPLAPEADWRERRARLKDSALPLRAANGFLPGTLRCTGPAAQPGAVVDYAKAAFARAAEVGVRMITFGSAAARQLPEGCAREDAELQFAALLARLAAPAAEHGVTVGVEPLQASECNFLNRLEDARRIVAAVDHPAIRLTADVFHMMRGGEEPAAIRKAGALVAHVHLAELRARTAPAVDGDDFRPWLAALKDAGFAGLISLECGWEDPAAQLPAAIAARREQAAGLE
jgi:sugar phosphate isomerase/epimerase